MIKRVMAGRLITLLFLALLVAGYAIWKARSPEGETPSAAPQLPPVSLPEGVEVSGPWVMCDAPGYSTNCVVDGDTFRIGDRRIRIERIDAPERAARCEEERILADEATRSLHGWLNRGAFRMLAEEDAPRDRYARELQTIWRGQDDLAQFLLDDGVVQIYNSRARANWC